MKKLFLSLTSVLLSLSLTACMMEESYPAADVDIDMAGAQRAVDVISEHDDIEAKGDYAEVKVSEGAAPAEEPAAIPTEQDEPEAMPTEQDESEPQQSVEEWECIAERPDDYEENSTVTTVSSPQPAVVTASTTSDETYNQPDTTSEEPADTAPANLNDPIPTMTYSSVNSAGEYEYMIQNNTQYEWGYGLEPFFDKYDEEQGVWLPVKPINEITVIEIYCILQPGGSSTYTLSIDQYYGDLSAGSYRVGLLMRNHETEMAEMVWYEFSVGIDESYWRVIECH